jgi:histidinol-phosphate aminotransferase
MLKARKCVREMREYHSPLSAQATELRLDMNENTTGCSARVLAKIRSLDAKLLALYPRREYGEKLIADFLGIRPSETMLTNGADEGIDLLCRAYLESDDELILGVPTFGMYEVFSQGSAAKVVRVPAGPEFSFPVDKVIQAITPRTRMIIVCNPNNPTGTVIERADILRVLEAAPDAAVLVDEAYFEFYGKTMLDQIGKIPNLFIARTFSKVYGLAGLRLGVLAGAAEQIAVLKRMASPFNINAFAIECMAEALADRESVEAYVQQVSKSREWLRKQLETLGVKCWPSAANFILANFGALKSTVLTAMRQKGIALRDRPDCEGCIRITIGTQPEMERVVRELQQILAGKPEVHQVAG